eukprot:scaffold106056_cov33-Phaeocystis_antarctica.AAC.1
MACAWRVHDTCMPCACHAHGLNPNPDPHPHPKPDPNPNPNPTPNAHLVVRDAEGFVRDGLAEDGGAARACLGLGG